MHKIKLVIFLNTVFCLSVPIQAMELLKPDNLLTELTVKHHIHRLKLNLRTPTGCLKKIGTIDFDFNSETSIGIESLYTNIMPLSPTAKASEALLLSQNILQIMTRAIFTQYPRITKINIPICEDDQNLYEQMGWTEDTEVSGQRFIMKIAKK